jgi:hypothetical protein
MVRLGRSVIFARESAKHLATFAAGLGADDHDPPERARDCADLGVCVLGSVQALRPSVELAKVTDALDESLDSKPSPLPRPRKERVKSTRKTVIFRRW